MIILGDKYKFNELELKKLNKKFKDIKFLKYYATRESSAITRKEIKNLLKDKYYKYLVINSDYDIDKKMIKFLTLLQFRYRRKPLHIISIQKLLERHLEKLYIPDDSKNLEFLMDIKPYNTFEYSIKRCVDLVCGGILYSINFFLKFYVKKKIEEESPGEIYFLQDRVGKNLKTFKCYKFRTMHKNSYFEKYTKGNDDRIFPFGKILRKTRVDEIPQAINVLKGDMHLIGPRAEWSILVKEYEKEIPYYNERHIVKPGITGWAQVNYPYGANIYDTKQKLMYDLYYIKHWSLWLEIKTIFKTIAIMIKRKGI
ncbi:exodeoxyribonuclease 7 large subunit [Campylobacter sputorum subsp. bubulus]|uniref:Exodeoxyribonuclease 7 large subunit n=1 Tax=Campylobacter sputorum subsp. sputorum TaxID=32024 RepID=A0A381DIM2_9BACT|nr:sugar transferase [Campylobacter sputorum]ASM35564.1 sugar transferase [Campylobacter sputorum aubsp. sputorum RM3237]KAB0582703.1 sugar transferase [Campylobacter sputorum subsp. sputorum]QEL05756.1 sugar transferase [Campylobacter sputorum subsp. sputorum]SUX08155.1 exodeoxyribonuclease 7 large subunit [Campylobacter sputorum subsp. bubulus]SUX10528.1 exodeoxyribonuclease 7 large subunit [Campylobacter sputorum subsp. sputorum]